MKLPADEFQLLRDCLRSRSPFTDAELKHLLKGMQRREVSRKEYVIEAGQICRSMGILLAGSVRYFHIKDGQEITGYFSLEGEWVGAYTSFLRQIPAHVSIQALEDATLLTFSHAQLREWENSPAFSRRINHFLRKTAEYLIECYEQRVTSFVMQTPEERYLDLMNNTTILQRIPQQYVANYLGITPVSLSRIRSRILA